MINRIIELYNKGGILEMKRGLQDYIFESSLSTVIAKFYSERTLEVNNIKTRFYVCDSESLKRSAGHGEITVLEDFVSNIKENDIVWDVGANQGTYSLFASGVGADTHGFEPGTQAIEIFRKNIELNNRPVTVHEIALGSENNTMILRESNNSGTRWVAEEGPGERVKVKRGDILNIPTPDVIKIDVEGAEIDVLRGLDERLKQCRVCYVECHMDNEKEIVSILEESGFYVEQINSFGNTMIRGTQ